MKQIQLLDAKTVKKDFPIFQRKINGKELVYLDSAATSLKPRQVIDTVKDYYENVGASVHRGIYTISEEATTAYEHVRNKVADLIDAHPDEIVYTKNATESINIVANNFSRKLTKGDEIVLTQMDHHANFVPWQQLAKKTGATLKFIEITTDGELELDGLITDNTKIVAVPHVSNVLGTVNDVAALSKKAHEHGAIFLVDGAQSVPHMEVSVRKLNADFFVFSGHKMLAPTGTGILYGKRELLDSMEPLLFGGDMIKEVTFESTTFNDVPWKFEAGTPNVAGVLGLGAAIDYLRKIGVDTIQRHENLLTDYAVEQLTNANVRIFGPEKKAGLVSFYLDKIHPHDVATVLDADNVAVRAGHHCAMPLMSVLSVPATVRASFYIYNTLSDIDALISGIKKTRKVFS